MRRVIRIILDFVRAASPKPEKPAMCAGLRSALPLEKFWSGRSAQPQKHLTAFFHAIKNLSRRGSRAGRPSLAGPLYVFLDVYGMILTKSQPWTLFRSNDHGRVMDGIASRRHSNDGGAPTPTSVIPRSSSRSRPAMGPRAAAPSARYSVALLYRFMPRLDPFPKP